MFDSAPDGVLIMLGECLERMSEMPEGSVDLVLTDPPYGTTACKWDAVIPFESMWREVRRVLKPNGAAVFTASQPFTSALVMSNIADFRYEWIWRKNAGSNFGTVKFQPMKEHESLLVFGKAPPRYHPQMQKRAASGLARVKTVVNYKTGTEVYGHGLNGQKSSMRPNLRYPSSVQDFNRERGFHPTQKPVALMEYMIKTYTQEGETVLDFTMGSGTTGVAAVNTGRRFVGIEKEAEYFKIAKRRIFAAQVEALLA